MIIQINMRMIDLNMPTNIFTIVHVMGIRTNKGVDPSEPYHDVKVNMTITHMDMMIMINYHDHEIMALQ